MGKLHIPKYKDENECYVNATSLTPIVSENLFHRVQEVIGGRRPINTTKNTCRDDFPLRGFLMCPQCGGMMTGSKALSRQKRYYYYYHCPKGCKEIHSVNKVHEAFEKLLASIVAQREVMELYQKLLKKFFGEENKDRLAKIRKLQDEIDLNERRVKKALKMMLDEEITKCIIRSKLTTFYDDADHRFR